MAATRLRSSARLDLSRHSPWSMAPWPCLHPRPRQSTRRRGLSWPRPPRALSPLGVRPRGPICTLISLSSQSCAGAQLSGRAESANDLLLMAVLHRNCHLLCPHRSSLRPSHKKKHSVLSKGVPEWVLPAWLLWLALPGADTEQHWVLQGHLACAS